MNANEKMIALLNCIGELNKLKKKVVKHIEDQVWYKFFDDMPNNNKFIQLFDWSELDDNDNNKSDNIIDDENEDKVLLFKVIKPNFSVCPNPDESIKPWLVNGWDNFNNEVVIRQDNYYENNELVHLEPLESNETRKKEFEKWLRIRTIWANEEKVKEKIFELFKMLFNANQKIQNESETLELMIGSGLLFDKDKKVSHPLLLRKVTIHLDSVENSIGVYDAGVETELYSALMLGEPFINQGEIKTIQKEVDELDYHPLDLEKTKDFFESIIHKLSPTGCFLDTNEALLGTSTDTLFIKVKPVLFIRRKLDGLPEFIDKMVSYIKNMEKLPTSIRALVGEDDTVKKSVEVVAKTFEEALAETSGEDADILLAKPANKEQLEIARQIEVHDSVIVQGPPGTGKTHTIANLIGDFLSKGQRVLVTSHTAKALKVLKEKLPEKLQSLCVSVIADDKKETEKAIDGISEEINNSNSRIAFDRVIKLKEERLKVINELTNIRKNIYTIKYNEFNTIAYEGESVSLSEMGRYIEQNKEKLNYIPGEISLDSSFPLSNSELVTLYSSNVDINEEEEKSLNISIINPTDLLEPNQFRLLIEQEKEKVEQVQNLKSSLHVDVRIQGRTLFIEFDNGTNQIELADTINSERLNSIINDIHPLSEMWMKAVALDGILGGSALEKWQILINQVETAKQTVNEVTSLIFGKKIEIQTEDLKTVIDTITKMKSVYESNGSIGFWTKLVNRDFSKVEKLVFVDGHKVSSLEDCEVILGYTRLLQVRSICANCWDSLLVNYNVPSFSELNVRNNFEQMATTYITSIKKCLSWYIDDISNLKQELLKNNIICQYLLQLNESEYTIDGISKLNKIAKEIIPKIIELTNVCVEYLNVKQKLDSLNTKIQSISEVHNILQSQLCKAIKSKNIIEYEKIYNKIVDLFNKNSIYSQRRVLLIKLAEVAPAWAKAIQHRKGIHGLEIVPNDIRDAWRWKQYLGIIKSLTKDSFEELQDKQCELSKYYRNLTEQLAGESAWYHLLCRMEQDASQKRNLNAWKQTNARIGKGKGKKAPKLKKEARRLLVQCQEAVPVWIMPIDTALTNLVPGETKFDVVIIDEASQADICALPILLLGKKYIVVGDDKQVSPMSLRVSDDQVEGVINRFIVDIIPNAHLYTLTTSIYDIAQQISQPLMLREHFRCVPDIIEYSNLLSYNSKIKPLRDASSTDLLPSIVPYRVNGERDGRRKINMVEAETIVALIQSCISMKEYKNKTFGVISLLGSEQAEKINNLLMNKISPLDYDKHKILCGDAANFQGDERDVIFLSMVDSNEGDGPLRTSGAGANDATIKRYNVAVSRAKDQLWIVHSLDITKDLKDMDLRKNLLDYALTYSERKRQLNHARSKADSPFETAVSDYLIKSGYQVVSQWEVGSYRIDMVAIDGEEKVAIECDGERWHSGEEKIKEDMERQTILERLGWRFIRIRGSEYYSNPKETMQRVIARLERFGIMPRAVEMTHNDTSELLQEIKRRAMNFLKGKTYGNYDYEITTETHTDSIKNELLNIIKRQF